MTGTPISDNIKCYPVVAVRYKLCNRMFVSIICCIACVKILFKRILALIPSRSDLESGRWTRWLAPWLGEARLWHWSRRSVALGVAIGIFFSMVTPIAQIPASVAASVLLRANIPAAMASTFISNPVTFAPIYYLAYRTGLKLTGEKPKSNITKREFQHVPENQKGKTFNKPVPQKSWLHRVRKMGKPLVVGLVLFGAIGAVLSYILVNIAWWGCVSWKRHRRLRH